MSVIIRLQGLPWSASALDIRHFFKGLNIPAGGVHIIGGERGDAFIAFGSDEDARQAMMRNLNPLSGTPVQLFLSSKSEMQSVIEEARAADSGGPAAISLSGGAATALTQQSVPALHQQGMSSAIHGQGLQVPYSAANQHFQQEEVDNQSQFTGAQNFNGAGQMQVQTGRDAQYGFPADKAQAMNQQTFPAAGIKQDQVGANSQYGFQTDRSQARFQSNHGDTGSYGGGYTDKDSQHWQGTGQGQSQGQDFQQFYGDDQFQGRPAGQQRTDQFMLGASGRDGQYPSRLMQQSFAGQGRDPMSRQDPMAFNQHQSAVGHDVMQQGPDATGRYPVRPGRPDQLEMGKAVPLKLGMPGYVDDQLPGRKLDVPAPRPLMGPQGMMRPDPQGAMRPDQSISLRLDQQAPVRPDRAGLLRPDQPGPMRPDQPTRPDVMRADRSERPDLMRMDPMRPERPMDRPDSLRPERPDLMRSNRPELMRPDRADPLLPDQLDSMRSDRLDLMRPDRLDPMRPDRQDPIRPERADPVRPDRPDLMRLERRDPLLPGRPEPLLSDQRPVRSEQPGFTEPRPGLIRGSAPGRPVGPPEEPKSLLGAQPDMARPRGRGMLPTPDMPPHEPASMFGDKRYEDPYADEAAMEHGRWPGYTDEEALLRGGPQEFRDDRQMRRDPDHRRPELDMGRGRGQLAEGGDSDFRNAPHPGGRLYEGPDGRRFEGPGGRPFDSERRFEGPGGRHFDDRTGYEDPRRFEDAAERHFEDSREYKDVHMRDYDPHEREFDRQDYDGHSAGRGFSGPRGRGFPGRRPEGPRGRGFERGRGRGLDDYGTPGHREFEHPTHPGEYPQYPTEEGFDTGHFEDMQTEDGGIQAPEYQGDLRERPYLPFDRDSRLEGGRGRIEVGRGRMEPGRGRVDGGRGRFDNLGGSGRGMDVDRRWNGPNREEVDILGREEDRVWRDGTMEQHSKPGLLGDAPPGLLPAPDVKHEDNRSFRDRDNDPQRDRDRRSYSDRRDRDDRDRGRDDRRRSDRRDDRVRGRDSRSSERSLHRDRDRDHRRDRDRDRERSRDGDRDRSTNKDGRSKERSSKDSPSIKKDEKSEANKKTEDLNPSTAISGKFVCGKHFPISFSYKDIRRFFIGCELPFDGIKFVNVSGQRTGEVYLKFASDEIGKRAMKHNGEPVQGTPIRLEYITPKDFENQVDSKKAPDNGNLPDAKVPGAGQEPPATIKMPEKSSLIIQIRGLPPNIKREDVVRFFPTVQIADKGDAVFIEHESLGQGTGIAYMEMASAQDFQVAMGYDGRLFGQRIIKLAVGRREEMDIVIKKEQEMFHRQADKNQQNAAPSAGPQGPMGPRPPLLPQGSAGARPGPQPLMSVGILGPPPRNGPLLMQPNQQQNDKPQGAQGEQPQSQDLCVHIQGLPMLATQRDIREFFSDLNIVQRGIQIVHDGVGKPMGEGFVEFASAEDKEKALKKDKTSMGRHIVAVKHIAKPDMIERLRNARLVGLPPGQAPPPAPTPLMQPTPPPVLDVRPKAIPPGVLNRQWSYLRCQNFPSNIGISEIMNFFKGYRAVGESIRLHFLADGSPTGNAVVGFLTKEDVARAMQDLNGKLCRQSPVLMQPAM